jgi:hypothetical protein
MPLTVETQQVEVGGRVGSTAVSKFRDGVTVTGLVRDMVSGYHGQVIAGDTLDNRPGLSVCGYFITTGNGIMSEWTVRGTVHLIEETKTFGQKGFRKRLVVLEQDKGKFINYIPLEFVQDGCDSVDELNVGDEIDVPFRLSGRKWQRDPSSEVKFFLSAEATGFKVLRPGGKFDDHGPPPSESEAPADEDWGSPF